MSVYKSFRGYVIARGKLDAFVPETVDKLEALESKSGCQKL